MRGQYPRDFTVFDLAEKFGISPLEVMQWPAAVYARAAMWFSSRNQAEADRAKNAERERERQRK